MLDGIVPRFQLNMGGFGFALALAIPYALYAKPSYRLPWKTLLLLSLLALTLYLQNITFFAATLYIPVGTNHSLNKFTSITITLVIAHIRWKLQGVLKIVDLLLDLLAAVAMITGIMLVIQPTFLFPNNTALDTEIKSFCNPDRLNPAVEYDCILAVVNNTMKINSTEPSDCLNTHTKAETTRPAWIGYVIGVTSGFLAVAKVFILKAIFKHTGIAQVMVFVPAFAFILSTITAVSSEDFHSIDGFICVVLLIFNFIGSMGAHMGFFLVMQNMPSTDYTIVSCLALVMLMVFQFTLLTNYVPTRTDPVAITGAIVISMVAIGKPVLHRWVSSVMSRKQGTKGSI